MFLFGDYFSDAGGDGFGSGDKVGQGELAASHGVFAGLEVDVFGLHGFDLGGDGGGLLEDGDAGAKGDQFNFVGIVPEGLEQVAHVAPV